MPSVIRAEIIGMIMVDSIKLFKTLHLWMLLPVIISKVKHSQDCFIVPLLLIWKNNFVVKRHCNAFIKGSFQQVRTNPSLFTGTIES